MITQKRFLNVIWVILFFALMAPFLAFAADFRAGGDYILRSNETVRENLYVAAGTANIEGTATEDVFLAAGTINVSGMVSGDLNVTGGTVNAGGRLLGDVRAFGGSINVSNEINGDLLVTGGNVRVAEETVVGKDMVLMGGDVVMNGRVNGKARIAGGSVTVNGTIRGDLNVQSSDRIIIGEDAVIEGDLIFSAPNRDVLQVQEGAEIRGERRFTEIPARRFGAAAFTLFALAQFLAYIVVAVVAVLIFNSFSQGVAQRGLGAFWWNLLWGFVIIVATAIAIPIMFATVVGSFLAILTMLMYGFIILLAMVFGGIIFGAWLRKLFTGTEEIIITWPYAILGIFLLMLIGLIPFVGWIVQAMFFFVAVAGIARILYRSGWRREEKTMVA